MIESRLKLLPILLEKHRHKLNIDIESGSVSGLKAYESQRGYLTVTIWHQGSSKYYRVHEIIAFVGGLDLLNNTVNHINGNKKDNRISNLEAISAAENRAKAKETKLFPAGEDNHKSKLTRNQVNEIRRAYTGKRGEQAALAEKYGVGRPAIYRILTFKTWKDVNNEEAI
jgi:hypothetical protein